MSRQDIIKCLKKIGFEGPFNAGGKHPAYMTRGALKFKLPNPHKTKDIGDPLLSRLKKQAMVTEEECQIA